MMKLKRCLFMLLSSCSYSSNAHAAGFAPSRRTRSRSFTESQSMKQAPIPGSASASASSSPLFHHTITSTKKGGKLRSRRSISIRRLRERPLFSSPGSGLDIEQNANANNGDLTSTPAPEQGTRMLDIRAKLAKISNIASMLCVIDCTVLPIVTVLLPLIGLGASPAQAHWLHELGHSVALFFVLPGGLSD